MNKSLLIQKLNNFEGMKYLRNMLTLAILVAMNAQMNSQTVDCNSIR